MHSWLAPQTSPLIIAHRGASRRAPENTLAAFSRAIDDGADGIELDVRLTCDRKIVVFHDSRLERTTDGRGKIELLPADRLKGLSAGSWFHPVFRAETIPSLDDVFELTGHRVLLNIEIKADRRRRSGFDVVDQVLKIIKRHRAESFVLLSSFHHPFLRYAGEIRPEIARGYLFHTVTSFARAPVRRTRRESGSYLIVNGSSCSRRLIRLAHESRVRVGEYTVNSSRRLRRAVRYTVDAIYTDDPAKIVREVSAIKWKSPP